jgi:hypothetical protein
MIVLRCYDLTHDAIMYLSNLALAVLLVSLSCAVISTGQVLLSKVPISDKQLIELERSYASAKKSCREAL